MSRVEARVTSPVRQAPYSVQALKYQGCTRQFSPDRIQWRRGIRNLFAAKAGRSRVVPNPLRGSHSWSLPFPTARAVEKTTPCASSDSYPNPVN